MSSKGWRTLFGDDPAVNNEETKRAHATATTSVAAPAVHPAQLHLDPLSVRIPVSLTSKEPMHMLVIFKKRAPSVVSFTVASFLAHVAFVGVSAKRHFLHAFHGFSAHVPPHLLGILAAHPDVETIEPNLKVYKCTPPPPAPASSVVTSASAMSTVGAPKSSETIPWGVRRVNGPRSQAVSFLPPSRPSGRLTIPSTVDVFVIDTGIDIHTDLGSLASTASFVPNTPANRTKLDGHGTHVAGTIGALNDLRGVVGVAPGVRLHSVRVLDSEGSGTLESVIAGIDHILSLKQASPLRRMVVNMSLGLDTGTVAYNALDHAVARAVACGVTMVLAAGNSGIDARYSSPAHVTSAITVGATDMQNRLAPFSNWGPNVTVCAPGVDISSTYLKNSYVLMSGTSMAAPHVTGAIACFLSRFPVDALVATIPTPAQIKTLIREWARTTAVTTARPGTTDRMLYVPDGILLPSVPLPLPPALPISIIKAKSDEEGYASSLPPDDLPLSTPVTIRGTFTGTFTVDQ